MPNRHGFQVATLLPPRATATGCADCGDRAQHDRRLPRPQEGHAQTRRPSGVKRRSRANSPPAKVVVGRRFGLGVPGKSRRGSSAPQAAGSGRTDVLLLLVYTSALPANIRGLRIPWVSQQAERRVAGCRTHARRRTAHAPTRSTTPTRLASGVASGRSSSAMAATTSGTSVPPTAMHRRGGAGHRRRQEGGCRRAFRRWRLLLHRRCRWGSRCRPGREQRRHVISHLLRRRHVRRWHHEHHQHKLHQRRPVLHVDLRRQWLPCTPAAPPAGPQHRDELLHRHVDADLRPLSLGAAETTWRRSGVYAEKLKPDVGLEVPPTIVVSGCYCTHTCVSQQKRLCVALVAS